MNSRELVKSYETLLSQPWQNDKRSSSVKLRLNKLRRLVLNEGLPDEEPPLPDQTKCSLRGRVWKLLLQVPCYSPDEYLRLVESRVSGVDSKIRNDTFRTLVTDKEFLARVPEDQLIRLLNAFARKAEETKSGKFQFSYVQGMNCLLAPFLFVMPEVDAFFAYDIFLRKLLPAYVQPSLEGVHEGVKLVDDIMQLTDPELYNFLVSKRLPAKIYAFPSILTLCCATPPLREVLKLWDFFFAFGPGMVVPCVVVQVIAIREELMKSESPQKLLRTFPPLAARHVISKCLALIKNLPQPVYEKLVRHPLELPS